MSDIYKKLSIPHDDIQKALSLNLGDKVWVLFKMSGWKPSRANMFRFHGKSVRVEGWSYVKPKYGNEDPRMKVCVMHGRSSRYWIFAKDVFSTKQEAAEELARRRLEKWDRCQACNRLIAK